MKSFKNILVVAGANAAQKQALLRPAVELAAPTGGVVTLLELDTRSGSSRSSRRITDGGLPYGPLHRLYDPGPDLRRLGVPVHHEIAVGVPHLEIRERIAVYGHDLVMMHGDSDLGRPGISGRSTVTRVLRGSSVPVWIHPHQGRTKGPIAVAVGPRDTDDPDDHLSGKLVAIGASLARSQQRDLHVIHAWRLDGETLMRSRRLNYEIADVGRMGHKAKSEATARVEELLADAHVMGIDTRVHVEKGHVGDVVDSLSDSIEPAVLIMGTIARQGIQGLLVGNTVERVARRTQSPVLAVKPDGFVSPRMSVEDWTPQALPY